MIVTTTVGDEIGVGVGFDSVGVGLGLEIAGVGSGLGGGGVGVKPDRDDVGVSPGGIDVGDSADVVFVVPVIVVLVIVGAGVAIAVLLSPPHAVKTTNSASIKRQDQAMLLDKHTFFTIHTTSSVWYDGKDEGNFLADSSIVQYGDALHWSRSEVDRRQITCANNELQALKSSGKNWS